MSKYISTENKPKGQVKPKLKIKVQFEGGDHVLNEYDLATMVSELNVKVIQLTQAVNGITNAMQAATQGVQQTAAPVQSKLNLPKLKTESSTLDTPENIYPNAADNVKLES
jgi:hypothetical protein